MDQSQKRFWMILSLVFIGLGIVFRFWHITDNQIFFYDEGMYLGYNRNFLNLVAANPPHDLHELFIILGLMFKTALSTAKALWFFVLNLRVFILGPESWYFARLVSAFCGVATVVLTYFFSYRYFQSRKIAILSAIFLSILPSHVFYSRLGMQESLSTFLFLVALFLYLFYRKNWSFILSGVLLACVFLTNYRMIISPVFILLIEFFESFRNRKSINWKNILVCVGTFCLVVFVTGALYGGINRYVTFGWMFHQAQEAKGQRNLISFFSYPYYTFALEGVLFALIFWANIYLLFKKQWSKILPFILAILQMGIFSLAAEKGARYICVVLPMIAIAAAVSAEYFTKLAKRAWLAYSVLILTCLLMGIHCFGLINAQTDYSQAVLTILKQDPKAKILSTQPLVEQLFVVDQTTISECPKNLQDFIDRYQQGYRYLILDPQVFISWTKDNERFSPPLIDFIEFIYQKVPPIATLNHLNRLFLGRFVLDHNQNLSTSLRFLSSSSNNGFGQIRIYNMGQCLMLLRQEALRATENHSN